METHKHHIIPKYLGGSNESSNLIELTVEEHAEAHLIRWLLYKNWQDEVAWKGLYKVLESDKILKVIMNQPEIKNHLSKKSKEYWANLDPEIREKRKRQFLEIRKLTTGSKGKSWKLKKETKDKIAEAKSKIYKIITPNNEELIIKNLSKFCRENNLDQAAMVNVSKGKNNHHKKYKCSLVN